MQLIPGYEIIEKLYESRRSRIYRARQEADGRSVVVKVLHSEFPPAEEIARLRREYRITRAVRAPGVIEMLAIERYESSLALVMEDIGGASLALSRASGAGRGPMDPRVFIGLAVRLAEALGEVHQRRVMHKDVTPQNVVWCEATGEVRLIDFGIATELPIETSAIVSPNVLEGTLPYMSPEQTGRMNRAIDYRTDLYSLGVTFYELLTGELPFSADDPLELVHCHIARIPRPPHEVHPGVPGILSEIVLKLMAKHAEDRYQSGFVLRADLAEVGERMERGGSTSFSIARGDASDRFQLPQKLYGRDAESRALLDAFDRVAAGSAETMFVAGYSGIGKSSLVHEVHRPIVSRRGYFVSGKFDQFQRNIPYASLIQAFRELTRQILTEPPRELARWRERILAALRPNARVIIDVIGEVALITGVEPPVPELPPREAENRLNFAFEKLFHVFGDADHPLVIFLDDLQWADLPSLKLLERLMGDPETRYVFFIGAYRDNEVDGQHPLLVTQAALRKAGARSSTITLGPLSHEHTTELLADTLRAGAGQVGPLAELCVRRTAGNPFFLSQYLLSLHHEGLFAFDARRGGWRWDMDRLAKAPMAANVVDLMVGKIKLLEDAAQRALKLAACIGARFDLRTLAVVSEKPAEAVAAALWPALREGLVLPLGDSYMFAEDRAAAAELAVRGEWGSGSGPSEIAYRFLHDRVQQAAYSLVAEADRPALHLTVGRLLRDATPGAAGSDRLFEIVNQLDAGAALITDEPERAGLAELNLAAARKAKAAAAYGAAVAYAQAALGLLDEASWTTRHDLTLAIHLEAAETSYLNADADAMDRYVDAVIAHAADLLERVRATEIRIQALMTQTRMVEAVATGQEILRLLGVDLPDEPTPADVGAALGAAQAAIGDKSIEALADMPDITDPRVLAALRILAKTSSSSYLAKPALFPIVVLRQVRLALEHGTTGAVSFGYVLYGLLRIAVLGDIPGGYAFGKLVQKLLERPDAKEYETRARACMTAFLTHWREPLRVTVDAFTEIYRAGFDTGDIEYTAWAGKHAVLNAYVMGDDLPEIRRDAQRYIETLTRFKQDAIVQYISTLHQVTVSLMGEDPEPWRLVGPGYDFEEVIASHRAAGDAAGLCWANAHRLVVCRLFDRTAEAREAIAIYDENAGSTLGMVYVPLANFYASLTWLAACAGAPEEERASLLEKVEANQKQMAIWAEHAPENRAHAHALVGAELARVRGDRERARDLYYRAMTLAREHGNRRDHALATELFARFLEERGEEEAAQLFMTKAAHLYGLWGARAKVRDIERRYPALRDHAAPAPRAEDGAFATKHTTSRDATGALDLLSVVRASQAISGEVVLPELLRRIMLVVIQNAGARRGLLIIPGARPLAVEVDTAEEGEPRVQIHEGTLDERKDVPHAVVRYVERTRRQVVLADASSEGPFQSDPDVVRMRARSILCLPVLRHGELAGILYLDNGLSAGAFTEERCQVLELLAAQAAISLENARLYETLENRVRERTSELTLALDDLRRTQRQLVAQEKLAHLGLLTSGIAHELKNPLNFVINFASLSTQLAADLRAELEEVGPTLAGGAAPISEIIDDIAQNAARIAEHGRRADGIVRSMLKHAGKGGGQREETDLNQVVHEAIRVATDAFQSLRPDFAVPIEAVFDPALAPIFVAPHEIGQVVLNLVSNACYAVWERSRAAGAAFVPRVVVTTRGDGDQVEIRVRDNGDGIPATVQEKLFLPFFTTKPTGDGTGLGLSLSHDIVAGHSGTIDLTTATGEGTEFVVRLPRRAEAGPMSLRQ
jgi:histidine kinase